jgi:hypothetical protein
MDNDPAMVERVAAAIAEEFQRNSPIAAAELDMDPRLWEHEAIAALAASGNAELRTRLKKAWHEATFLQGAQTPCAKHLFDAIDAALSAITTIPDRAPSDDRIAELEQALTDTRNNILQLLGFYRDEMPPQAVTLFQRQVKQIDATLHAKETGQP